jgi:methylthioribose-1-phosphate isomerase
MAETLRWIAGSLELLDQTRIPHQTEYVRCSSAAEVSQAIRTMVVRGAPAIGIAAAYGVACEALRLSKLPSDSFHKQLRKSSEELASCRPTAVNLKWAVDQMLQDLRSHPEESPGQLAERLLSTAIKLHQADVAANMSMGVIGAALIPKGARILTHCNAGALATSGFGTALGIIRHAWLGDKTISVVADETRPLLQGARLTAWELLADGIPTTLISDNMSGFLMSRGEIDVVVVGADRVARNGDVANKIGTYMVAVLAARHKIPFYVACPTSTIDLNTLSGDGIRIEERDPREVTGYGSERWAPEGVSVRNPAFDVTPHSLVSAIVTESGVIENPSETTIASHLSVTFN